FFIWNSPIKAQYSSLDYYSESNRDLFKEPARIIEQWLTNSVSFGSDLFVKTHAHSMKWEYEIFAPESRIPHLYPDVVTIFEDLLRVCDVAGVDFRPVTVNDVMGQLQEIDQGRPANVQSSKKPGARSSSTPASATGPGKAGPTASKRGRSVPAKPDAEPEAADALEPYLLKTLRNWVHEDPQRTESAGTFYLELLKGKHVLQDYERAVLDYILAKIPPGRTTILEVGVGYGILCLFLAASGYEVIACEGSRSRLEGFEFLAGSLVKRFPDIAKRVRAVHGWFPDAFDPATLAKDRRNVLITTNIVASASASRQGAILEAAASFDDIIVDTTRFGVARYDPGKADELRRTISARCQPIAAVWRRKPNEIWHFQPRAHTGDLVGEAARKDIAAGSPLATTLTIDDFNAEVLALQREWIEGDGSSLPHDDLYAAKIRRGATLEAHEIALGKALAERFDPADAAIVEIGSGYGALALYLGRNGFAVRSFEGDRRRAAAAAWHLKRQVEQHPDIPVRFTAGFFPDAATADLDTGAKKRVCIATNVTCTYTDTHHEAILETVASFDEFIFDLARFGHNRNAQQERDALRDELVGRGFEAVERIFFSEPYEYWRFRMPEPARHEAAPAVVAQSAEPVRVESAGSEARAEDEVFPLRDDGGVIYSVFGDRRLEECPVCGGRGGAQLWRMPMSNLAQPITGFGGYYHQAPSLQVPATVYCFDFCRDCRSIYLNPAAGGRKQAYRENEHNIRMMENEAAWRGYEEVFDRFVPWLPAKGSTMVDAACGIGQYLEVARKRAPDRWRRLVGLELSEKYVDHMRKRNLEAHVFDLDNDSLAQVVKPGAADLVFFCEAFQYVERPVEAIRKLLQSLRPGGRLCFTALRYGRDVHAGVRPSEPIYVGESFIGTLPQRLSCLVVDVQTSAMRYYVTLEKK
ncbi:MAG: methyltransferase domain-containing protein, partial [Alphaproteobacteria bacterium]|nr:methyltransferase domain-containing protein [Alphaproteobacteria bacterium]